jgi:hypothetical protein
VALIKEVARKESVSIGESALEALLQFVLHATTSNRKEILTRSFRQSFLSNQSPGHEQQALSSTCNSGHASQVL